MTEIGAPIERVRTRRPCSNRLSTVLKRTALGTPIDAAHEASTSRAIKR